MSNGERKSRDNITYLQMLKRFPRLYAFMKRYKLLILGVLLMSFAQFSIVALPPLIIRYAIDEVIPAKDVVSINLLFGFIVFIYITSAGFRLANTYIRWYLGAHIGYDIRKKLFDSLLVQCQKFYAKRASGEITSRLNNDVRAVEYLASQALFEITSGFFQLAISAGFLFYLSWKLTVVVLGLTLVMFVFVTINMNQHKKLRKRLSEKWGRILGYLQETLANIRIVKAFCAERKEAIRHTQKSRSFIIDNIRSGIVMRLFWAIGILFFNLFTLATIVYGVSLLTGGEITLGLLFAFVMYIRNFFMPIFMLSGSMTTIVRSFISIDRIYTYTESHNEIVSKKDALEPAYKRSDSGQAMFERREAPRRSSLGEAIRAASAAAETAAVTTSAASSVSKTSVPTASEIAASYAPYILAFDSVKFNYEPEKEKEALRGITLAVRDGESIAFVGPSGAGKTTIINLLLRYYDPTRGRILLYGTDLRDLDLDAYRNGISVVFQDALLFNDTIRNNLKYAKEGATQEQIDQACRDACIYDFVTELPDGYETVIGERGIKLSGGQRQRLSIARAILKDPHVLLLDEATSSIDSVSENRIQAALDNIMASRTTIVIAHRLTTIINVDTIYVLSDGLIIEKGNHQELLAHAGLYRQLWTAQMKEGQQRAGTVEPDESSAPRDDSGLTYTRSAGS